MTNSNICKFILPGKQTALTTEYFIYETTLPFVGEERTLTVNIVYLVVEGEADFVIAGNHHTVNSGCIFFAFGSVPFRIHPKPDFKCFSIRFYGTRSAELFHRFNISAANAVFPGHNSLIPKWQEYFVRANDENTDILSESLLLYTFSVLKPTAQRKVSAAEKMLDYLEHHFTDAGLSLSVLADELGYSTKYLSTVFKRQYGIGFINCLQTRRINYAIVLFNNGVTSIKNVATLSGFSDPLYFSRLFSETVGVPPKKYIEKITNAGEVPTA